MTRFELAHRAVARVSQFLVSEFRTVRVGTRKSDGTLVSRVDLEAEKIVADLLRKNFPEDGTLFEESKEKSTKTGWRWILDPLDGTHNFLYGLPIWGCLLALEHNSELQFGLCSFPLLSETFSAQKGKGAFFNGKRIRVTRAQGLKGGMYLADGIKGEGSSFVSRMKAAAESGVRTRLLGSAPYGFTRVAMGDAVAADMKSGKPWDIAAPTLLVLEAGGVVTDDRGKPWSLHTKDLWAASRPGLRSKKGLNAGKFWPFDKKCFLL